MQRYLWLSGRSSRREWWIVHIACLVALTINDEIFLKPVTGGRTFQIPLLWLAIDFLLLWISFTSIVRRLHDRNKSGWWAMLYLVPFVGWAWLFIECGFLPGRAASTAQLAAPPEAYLAIERRSKLEVQRKSAPPVQRTGLVQRAERRPWNFDRLVKVAGHAIGILITAYVLYQWFVAPAEIFTSIEVAPTEMKQAE
jgi:uncharacterized membrane protein YhaH (DUF805 family)